MKDIPFEVQVAIGVLSQGGLHGHEVISMVDKAIEDYPDWFPDITERRKIFASIPQEVHEAYDKELKEIEDWYKEIKGPESLGVMGWIKNPDKLLEFDNFWKPIWQEREEKEEALKEKHYRQFYGDLWNGLNRY